MLRLSKLISSSKLNVLLSLLGVGDGICRLIEFSLWAVEVEQDGSELDTIVLVFLMPLKVRFVGAVGILYFG